MTNKEKIKEVLNYYNDTKVFAKENEDRFNTNDKFNRGVLCGLRYVLIECFDFKTNDKRF